MAELLRPGVLFKKGNIADLKKITTGQEGTFYLAEDEQNLYFGDANGAIKRIQGNVKFYLTLKDFQDNVTPPYSEDLIYFIADNNALVRWDNNRKVNDVVNPGWVQLNATAESVKTAIDALNSAVDLLDSAVEKNATDIATNAKAIDDNAKAIATKAAQSDLTTLAGRVTTAEGKIQTNIEQIALKAAQADLDLVSSAVEKNAEDIAKLDEKVDTKAAQSDLTILAGRVTTAEGTIAEHTTAIGLKANQADLEALDTRTDNIEAALENHGGLIEANATNLANYKTENNQRVADAEAAINKAKQDIVDLNNNKADDADLTALTTRVELAESALEAHDGRISTNASEIVKVQNAVALKAAQSDLTKLEQNVGTISGKVEKNISDISNLDSTKADKSQVNEIAATVNNHADLLAGLRTDVDSKTSQSDFNDLVTTVSGKATKIEVNDLVERVEDLEEDSEQHGTDIANLKTAVNGLSDTKLNAATYNNYVNETLTPALERLEGMENGANRTYVDTALNYNLTTDDGHAISNKAVSDEISSMKTDHQNLVDAVNDISDALGLGGVGSGESLSARITDLENNKADKTDVEQKNTATNARIDTLSGTVTSNTNRIAANETNIDLIESTLTTLATKNELADTKEELLGEISDQIDAANAMTYKQGVAASTDLPTSDVKVGDTFVVTTSFTLNDTALNPGDLLVATGTEVDGVISGNVSWTHVQTGYSTTFDQKLSAAAVGDDSSKAQIQLSTFAGALGTAVELSSDNESLTIEVVDDQIKLNMVWGSF